MRFIGLSLIVMAACEDHNIPLAASGITLPAFSAITMEKK